jgi:hypothetical protein
MADSDSGPTTFPIDESNVLIWNDRTNLEGLLFQGIAYGVHAVVFVCAINGLFSKWPPTKKNWILAAYAFLMFSLGTFMVGANAQVCVSMFVDNRNFIAGPSEWIAENYAMTANAFGNAVYIIANFFADTLLLYRVYVVWNKNPLVMVFPTLLFCASTGKFINFR